jgi:hypothetical protein
MGFRAVFLHIQSDEEAALFKSQVSTIVALTKGCKSAKVVRDVKDIPEGCGGTVVTSTIGVHALVRVSTLTARLVFMINVSSCRASLISRSRLRNAIRS